MSAVLRSLARRALLALRLPDLMHEAPTQRAGQRPFRGRVRILGLEILDLQLGEDLLEDDVERDLSGGSLTSDRIGFATPTYRPEWDQGYEDADGRA